MRHRLLILGLLLMAVLPVSCAVPSSGPSAVVLIVIDTLRADHLGSYGYPTAHTPQLDALAARGVRFADTFSSVPVTLPSVCTILTGRYPFEHGVRDNAGFVLAEAEITLAERFRDAGYRTGAVAASAVLSADRGTAQGFDEYEDDFKGQYPFYQPAMQSLARDLGQTTRRADTVTDLALEMVEGFGNDEYFLFVHYFDPHSHYDPPPQYRDLHPRNLYDGEVSFVDAQVGRLLEAVDRDDAMIVVVADHGEGLRDHGEFNHGFLLYQSTLHVPWIVAGPGVPVGLVREDAVALVDVEPTLARACGLDSIDAPRRGRALAWSEVDENPPPHYAETFRTLVSYGWSELRALRQGRWKVIQGPGTYELFDLSQGFDELEDLGPQPAGDELAAELAEWIRADDPERVLQIAQGMPEPERIEALQTLGYVGSSEPVPPRPERPHPKEALPRWTQRQFMKKLLREGMSYVERGEVEQGLERLDKVLDTEPDNVTALYYRGLALEHVGRREEGEADLARAEQLDPTFGPLQLEFALRLERQGKHEEARRRIFRVLESEPEQPDALALLCDSYLRQGMTQEALEPLRTLVVARPTDARARFLLAQTAHRLGIRDEAQAHYEEILRRFPNFERADEVRRNIDDLQ